MYLFGRDRIYFLQSLMTPCKAMRLCKFTYMSSYLWVAFRCVRKSEIEMFEIVSGATADDRYVPIGNDLGASNIGQLHKIPHRELFPGFSDINEMMRYAVQESGIGFC